MTSAPHSSHHRLDDQESDTLHIESLACVGCAEALERQLSALPDVEHAHVDFRQNMIHLRYRPGRRNRAAVEALIAGFGCACMPEHDGHRPSQPHPRDEATQLSHRAAMAPITMGTKHDRMQYEAPHTSAAAAHDRHGIHPPAQAPGEEPPHHEHGALIADPAMAVAMERDMRNRFLVALILTIPIVLLSALGEKLFGIGAWRPFGLSPNWPMLLLSIPVVFWSGWIFIGGAATSLRHRMLNMSVLIAVGVLAAWTYSAGVTLAGYERREDTFFEAAAMLVTFVLFGHWMEMKSRRGTTDALRALLELVPPTATVLRDGREVEVPTSEIVPGDLILIRPGDRIPVDGEIVSGQTSIDESLVTGESIPVDKGPGDPVIGGSINRSGAVTVRATRVGAESTLAQIVKLVETAQSSKAPGQRLADRAAQYLVILAVGSGVVTFLAWLIFGDVRVAEALTFAISAVVIACPDALGLATPTAVAVGTGIGARHQILIKDAETLERLAHVNAVVLDKTGTLTEGRPRLTDVLPAPGWSAEDVLRLLAAAEQPSEHPIARAIVDGARERGLALPEATRFQALSGRGLEATVEGRIILAGNAALMAERGIVVTGLESRAADLAEAGKTPMYVAIDGQLAGVVAVADTLRPTSLATIQQLRQLRIEPVMITGDNVRTARALAAQLGIERVFAEVTPADKARYVAALQQEGKVVAMVGDGINDAPALAQADVGIAIGAGTDVAIETARVVLMRSDPFDVVRAIRLSRATVRKMKQNLVWASVYNVLAIPIAAGVLYPAYGIQLRPEWAALLMSLSSIIVATNAVLLKRVEGDLGEPGAGERAAPAPRLVPGAARPG